MFLASCPGWGWSPCGTGAVLWEDMLPPWKVFSVLLLQSSQHVTFFSFHAFTLALNLVLLLLDISSCQLTSLPGLPECSLYSQSTAWVVSVSC